MNTLYYTPEHRYFSSLFDARFMGQPKNLVESWLAAEHAAGRSRTQAVKELNKACDARYRLNRTYEWQRGVREVPPRAMQHMIRVSLRYVLQTEGIGEELTRATVKRIADRLS